MTDEEHKEAKALTDRMIAKHCTKIRGSFMGAKLVSTVVKEAYAAACEAKRAEIEELRTENEKHRWRLAGAQVDITLEAERVRSAKLLSSLEVYGHLETLAELNDVRINAGSQVARKAIAEYEAGRD